jgi:hypothetical protein
MVRTMSLISDARHKTPGATAARDARTPGTGRLGRSIDAGVNTVRASQARAALRRDARRDELAVAHWLRELTGRPR